MRQIQINQTHLEDNMKQLDKILEQKMQDLLENIEFSRTVDSQMTTNNYFRLFDSAIDDEGEDIDADIDLNEVSTENIVDEFTKLIEDGDDEIEISYEDGTKLVIDSIIIEHLLDVCSEADLIEAAESPTAMYQLLQSVYENIYELEDEDE